MIRSHLLRSASCLLCLLTTPLIRAQDHHHHHDMTLSAAGMVMNENRDRLPRDCAQISAEHEFTVRAGVDHALDFPGTVFGMDQHEYRVEPCSRVTVTFINEDQVRHQWMVHGLPRYLYPGGMFHLEAAGGHRQTGQFIVPGDDRTYLVHCDMAQHMEKGMKGQLKVGRGDGDLWAIPGVSGPFRAEYYLPAGSGAWLGLAMLLGAVAALALVRRR